MGTTFSTIQIQNQQQYDANGFTKAFTEYIAKRGFMSTTAESAQFSIYLAFSDTADWVTISSQEYDEDPDFFKEEVRGLAKALKTCCIGTSVFDSDVVALDLFNYTTLQNDSVLLGSADAVRCYFAEEENVRTEGKPECWQPLLAANKTWDELSEIWSAEYICEEDVLAEMASLLNMDAKNIAADYKFMDAFSSDYVHIVKLYFSRQNRRLSRREPDWLTVLK